jgi:tellurite methyltransferase
VTGDTRAGEPPFAVRFFEEQFRRQVEAGEHDLNPFETLALEHARGDVLDLGCGLGHLALEAARRGCSVTAVEASPTAVAHVRRTAGREGLRIRVVAADVRDFPCESYDTVACIGVLMFLDAPSAERVLRDLRDAVRPGGVASVNVLVEGTTFLTMFDPGCHHLFGERELDRAFTGWETLAARTEEFPAPGGTVKRFRTLVARKPQTQGDASRARAP